MSTTTASMQDCIHNCQECQTTLNDMLTATCLAEGGFRVQQSHVKIMRDCAAACAACVDFMSRNSDYHAHYCKACAVICKACMESCKKVGGMDKCIECCRRCHESCSEMAVMRLK